MKEIYHYDPSTKIFIGVGEADPSPLEENVWLIPAFATDVAPPKIPVGMVAVWYGAEWRTENAPTPEPEPNPPVPPAPTPEELLAKCKAMASSKLQETDYSQLPDVVQILENKAEFDAYREQIRQFIFQPVEDPMWPVKPTAVWKVA